jgi:aryl-alcohol dehydrogenase (NADP+)
MGAWQFAKSLYTSDRLGLERFVSMQNHYNLAYREEEREMVPLCVEERIAVNPWSPLGRGFLTGKYSRGATPAGSRYQNDDLLGRRYFRSEDFDVLERLGEISKEKDLTMPQVALAWLLNRPGVTSPVVGVTSVRQLEELVVAVDAKVSADEMKRLEEPYRPHPVLGHT